MIVRLCLVLALLSAVLCSQRVTYNDPQGGSVNVTVAVSGGASYGVGLGFARVEIENATERAHAVDVALRPNRRFGGDVQTAREVVAEPGSSQFFLPIPVPPVHCRIEVQINGRTFTVRHNYSHSDSVVSLFVSDRSGRASHGMSVLDLVDTVSYGGSAASVPMSSEDLPTDWRMLTAFSMIVVDGATVLPAGMNSEVQEAICRYAYAGGAVVVSAGDSLVPGPLRDLAAQARSRVLTHGLGHITSIARFDTDRSGTKAVLAEMPQLGSGMWPATHDLFPEQHIEGLGKAPVTVFVFVILAFAILVGPVNFMILRRRKKPLAALVTVPALGFGTTLVILAYGIFHDGFTVRGVAKSCTLLDQARHEAVSVNASTLFAGLAPGELTMKPDSMLLSQRAGFDREDWVDRWNWNDNTQRLDGGILPSRTVTPLLSVQQGPVRERLTVRRSGDTLELLLDGGIEPVGQVVLRDFDGQHWAGDGKTLQRVSSLAGQRLFASIRSESADVSIEDQDVRREVRVPFGGPAWGQRGTYATRVAKAPWLDDHGLSVAYDQEEHFVFGRLHAEDFVQ